MASRINGIGIAHLGAEPHGDDGTRWATLWFTFLFAPVFPIRRQRLQLLEDTTNLGYAYRVIETGPHNWPQIARSYFFSWILIPLAIFGPAVVLLREVWRDRLGFSDDSQITAIVLWCIWLVVWVWKLANWHEERFQPAKR